MSATLRTTIGEFAITGESYLRMFVRGNWAAVVELTSFEAPAVGSAAVLAVQPETKINAPAAGPDLFVGTVRHVRAIPGSETLIVRVVGGAGRLFSSVAAAGGQVAGATQVQAGLVLRQIADRVGERLAPGVEAALDAYEMPRWHRAGGTSARDAIDLLIADVAEAEGIDLGWRMLADGTIWAGVETWPAASGEFYTGQEADDGTMVYAPSGAPLRPGQTVEGERAVEVTYVLASPAMRALVRHRVPGDVPPPVALEVRSLYRATWGARVEAARGDGTLDLVCDDARMGELLAVPFRLGIPGCKVTVPAGSRVRLRFDDGSPRSAYACDVDQDPAAAYALALVGDTTANGAIDVTAPPGGGPCVVIYYPPGSPTSITATEITGIINGIGHRNVKGVRGP